MKILVCGGRDYSNYKVVCDVLDDYLEECQILIQGGAPGADALAAQWAAAKGIHCAQVNALWKYYRNAAGPKRNQAMLFLQPDIVIAFPGNAGTRSMVSLARASSIPVHQILSHSEIDSILQQEQ